jgi:membrane dipeptidase
MAAGCGEVSDGGLSDFGQAVVREMNRCGVLVDIAHSGQQTTLDAVKASAKPVVASHSTCAGVNPHCRARTDAALRALADSGGYCGICCVPGFLGGVGDISALLDHIDYIVKKFGVDYVAIGTDLGYHIEGYPDDNTKTFTPPKRFPSFVSLWPGNSFPREFETAHMRDSLAWTNWPLFTVGLVQRGYADADIRKIVGGNVMRVARSVLADLPATIAEQSPCVLRNA